MANQESNRIIDVLARIAEKIGKGLVALADWIREFHSVARLARFSFWISVLGSAAFFATSQSMEILRVIGEDREHRAWALSLFAISALIFSLMSWYWARVLIYRFEPDKLDLPHRDPRAIAARWVPRVCGIIPFVGIGYALLRATNWLQRKDEADCWLVFLFWLNLVEGVTVFISLYLRHKIAKLLRARFSKIWPAKVKSKGTNSITDLPTITWVVLLLTVAFSTILFILFTTSPGQIRVSGYLGPAPLVLISVASWIAFGSFFVIYFGKLIRLPILTPLLILAFLFSYFDLNDNHAVRSLTKSEVGPREFDQAFQDWYDARSDKASFKDRPYPVFIVTAEGGGITTGYFTATVLTAIQDRAPNFAQHVFAISGVSGGSVGAAVYAGLAKRCGKNVAAAELPGRTAPLDTFAGELQKSADQVLGDDYLSPALSAFLYPDLLQRFLPFAIPSWDRARAIEARFETSWAEHATCDGKPFSGQNELSNSFYDFFTGFPKDATPAIFFNTTHVESGERMFVTNLRPPNCRFDTLPALANINESFNLPFSSAALLSGRFPVITPAGFINNAQGAKLRYVDGGYYENSGAATAFNILMSLKVKDGAITDEKVCTKNGLYVYDALLQRDPRIKIIPVIIRIGLPVPEIKSGKVQRNEADSKERGKYKTQGLNEVSSPVKALLNTRTARGDDSVRQLETAMNNLQVAAGRDQPECTAGCVINIVIEEDEGTRLPLGWLLSQKSRCVMQQQVGSVTKDCKAGGSRLASAQIQRIIAMLAPQP